jgi:hypothetical protein
MASVAFLAEMERKRGSNPRTKIEFIDKTNTVTDISRYFLSIASFEQVKERAPDEIQAGEFDVALSNVDDTFSEYKVGSLFYGLDYHGSRIRVSEGFLLPDGTEEYEVQGVGYIDILSTDPQESRVMLRCRDILWRIMDQKIHPRPADEVVMAGLGNTGDGVVTGVGKLPFATVTESWTLTCTTPGGDAVAIFSVVGSVSGNIGNATSGTEFVDSTAGIRFTIRAGPTNWAAADTFQFDLLQHPEWTDLNAGKIIWSILTGYDWDTNVQESFSDLVFDFDNTQSSANTELDYDSFATAISIIDSIGVYDVKGFVPYDSDAIGYIQSLLVMFLGSLYTGSDGRIKLSTYVPPSSPSFTLFSDDKKIKALSIKRSVDEIINSVTVLYKGSDIWQWSAEGVYLDGSYVLTDPTSVTKYKLLQQVFEIPWYSTSRNHVQDFADKLIKRFAEPPLNIEFQTGLDALLTQIGDRVQIIDTKTGIDTIAEVTAMSKTFDQPMAAISMRCRVDQSTNTVFGAIGSEIDEGDGLSPQSDDYDTASVSDKSIAAYFSQVGDTNPPQYRMF